MQIFIEKQNKRIEQEFTGTALQLLKELAINPETVLIAKNDTLITPDMHIANEDTIALLSVISGG